MSRARVLFALALLAACTREAPPAPPPTYGPPGHAPRAPYGAPGYGGPPPAPPPPAPPPGSAGCGRAARAGVLAGQRVQAAGRERTYTLVVPEGYAPARPYPLVFVLHGSGGNGARARAQLDLERVARGAAVAIYPDAAGGAWDLDAPAEQNRDVALFDALLFATANALCVDLRRVFVAGFSNGAYMANQLGCRRGDRIRAVATHAGGGPYEMAGRYDEQGHLLCAGKAVAALVIHGTSDRVVAPSEGDKSLAHWAFANRCSGPPVAMAPAGCQALGGCAQPVATCRVAGLGHAVWGPGKEATWAFFDALR